MAPNPNGKRGRLATGLLSGGEVARLSSLHPMTVYRWAKRGALHPRRFGAGKGSVHGYTLRDVVAARVIATLRLRHSAQHVQRLADTLERWGHDLASAVLTVDRGDIYAVVDGRTIDVMSGQQMLIPLGPVIEGIRRDAMTMGISLPIEVAA